MNIILTHEQKKEFERLKTAYLKAKVVLKNIQEIDKKIKLEVLQESKFIDNEDNRITTTDLSYMIKEELFPFFLKKVHEKWLEYDLEHIYNESLWAKYEFPCRIAADNFLDFIAKNLKGIIKEFDEDTIQKIKTHTVIRNKFLDLALKLIA